MTEQMIETIVSDVIAGEVPTVSDINHAQLEEMPTLGVGQADDRKIDRHGVRVFLCRCGVADGMPYDNQITIERYSDDAWEIVTQYEG